MSLDPAVAAVRRAVREHALSELGPGPVLVACSGGADSLALLAAAIAETHDRPVVGVTVDHGLQRGSAERAERLRGQMTGIGASEAVAVRVDVRESGQGLEAAARAARYAALSETAERAGAAVTLLGHTRDDQAETVLLGLTRGSGGRAVRGMPAAFEGYRRPLLAITRAQTEAACVAGGIDWWADPHNADRRFTRARIRHVVLPMLEAELGPGIAAALARTGEFLRRDTEALDRMADSLMAGYDERAGWCVTELRECDEAIRARMLRLAALRAGSPAGELFAVHVRALEAQVWNRDKLPKEIQLPGHVSAHRRGDRLRFVSPGTTGGDRTATSSPTLRGSAGR
ncbi:MAG: tRNA lysidine(34) synthetase TilS [Nocardioides sp.]